jgi:hypothetical protein
LLQVIVYSYFLVATLFLKDSYQPQPLRPG